MAAGPKALGKFRKLVMRRIKWTGGDDDEMEDEEDQDEMKVRACPSLQWTAA
jgi:hypothetical protein